MPEYAPDYNYFLENNDMFWKLSTSSDGKINSIYCYKDAQAPFYLRTQFRKDWLDEWGMDVPETFDEYEAYFQKVQEEYPNVSPFTLEVPCGRGSVGEVSSIWLHFRAQIPAYMKRQPWMVPVDGNR